MGKRTQRDDFRESVMSRDKDCCVFCGKPATSAHHIMDRSLFTDGGYDVNNGASVCDLCHLKCETTEFTVEDVREAASITKVVLPSQLSPTNRYNKWGDVIDNDGNVLIPGPMNHLGKVKKALRLMERRKRLRAK